MYMLKSAGKRNQLLVFIDQLFLVAKVQSRHHATPRLVKWTGWQCNPPRISSGQDAMPHWPVVPSICRWECEDGGACSEGIDFCVGCEDCWW